MHTTAFRHQRSGVFSNDEEPSKGSVTDGKLLRVNGEVSANVNLERLSRLDLETDWYLEENGSHLCCFYFAVNGRPPSSARITGYAPGSTRRIEEIALHNERTEEIEEVLWNDRQRQREQELGNKYVVKGDHNNLEELEDQNEAGERLLL
jgi:hypothetical protein